MNEFIKITNPQFQKDLQSNYENNKEFQSFINALEKDNFNFEYLNHEKKLVEEYFESVSLCSNLKNECHQEVMGFRKKIEFLNKNFFITLTRCIHSQNPKLLFQTNYIYDDFPGEFKEKSFRDLKNVDDEDRLKLLQFCNNFIKERDSVTFQKGFYLFGSSRTGKTFLTALFMNKLILKTEMKVAFINANKIIWILKENWGYSGNTEFLYKKLLSAKYLVIDNLGLEPMTNYYRDEFFVPLLNDRFNRNLPTFFLSVYKIDDLQKIYTFSSGRTELVRANAFFTLLKKMTQCFELKRVIES